LEDKTNPTLVKHAHGLNSWNYGTYLLKINKPDEGYGYLKRAVKNYDLLHVEKIG